MLQESWEDSQREICLLPDSTPNSYQAFNNHQFLGGEEGFLIKVWVGVKEVRKKRELREGKIREEAESRDLLQCDGCSNSKETQKRAHARMHTHTHGPLEGRISIKIQYY